MELSRKQVEEIALLARLELTEKEKEQFTAQLKEALRAGEKLQELNTENILPTAQVLSFTNVMRPDELLGSLLLEDALVNAPDKVRNCFRVPRVIED